MGAFWTDRIGLADLDVGEVAPIKDVPGQPWRFDLFEATVDELFSTAQAPLGAKAVERGARRRVVSARRRKPAVGARAVAVRARTRAM
jgi:hypothetical protein